MAIARALVSSGELIVLDEPITNLDAKLREEMIVEIQMIQKSIGTTIVYITHDQEAALQLCDRIAIMRSDGGIAQVGTDAQIIKNPADRYVYSFIGVSNFIPVTALGGGLALDVGEKIPLPGVKAQGNTKQAMGVRPMNIVFDESSPIRAKILRAVFLGNQYDYFIALGSIELRVERNALDALEDARVYREGDEVGVSFLNPVFYEEAQV